MELLGFVWNLLTLFETCLDCVYLLCGFFLQVVSCFFIFEFVFFVFLFGMFDSCLDVLRMFEVF